MPCYIVTVKPGADKEQLKDEATAAGGTITHDYTLIPAFAVEFPEGYVHAFDNHPDVQSIEQDSIVTTQ